MPDVSSKLGLPFLQPAQAQKHVTVNESLLRLDALTQLSVTSATTAAQPSSPVDGAVYLLPAGKTGTVWGAMANGALAYWRDGVWEQLAPKEGWLAWVQDTNQILVYDGAAWSQSAIRTGIGLGTAATQNTGASGSAIPLLNVVNTWSAQQMFSGNLVGLTFGSGGKVADQSSPERTLIWAAGDRFSVITENGGAQIFDITPSGMTVTNSFFTVFHAGMSPAPATDNANSLGNSSFRFSTVYAATGAINTSDAREKTALVPLPDSVKRAVRRVIALIGVFQWREAVERKGQAGARLHIGITAQAVRDAFLAEGEEPARWGLFCADAVVERYEVSQGQSTAAETIGRATGEPTEVQQAVAPVFAERPVLDETGAPLVRLGVRADQLMWLALAATFA